LIDCLTVDWSTNCLKVDWSTDCLRVDWSTDRLTVDWLIDCLTVDWSTDRLMVDWLIDCLTVDWSTDRLMVDWLIDRLMVDWLIDCLTVDWLTNCLRVDWSVDRLTVETWLRLALTSLRRRVFLTKCWAFNDRNKNCNADKIHFMSVMLCVSDVSYNYTTTDTNVCAKSNGQLPLSWFVLRLSIVFVLFILMVHVTFCWDNLSVSMPCDY